MPVETDNTFQSFPYLNDVASKLTGNFPPLKEGELITIEGYYSPIRKIDLQIFKVGKTINGNTLIEPEDKEAVIEWRKEQFEKWKKDTSKYLNKRGF